MEISGKIVAALERKGGLSQKTGNQWASQEFVIETHEQYPKRMVFEVFGEERLTRFDVKVGVECTVYFDIMASEYNGKWYNRVRAYDVRVAGVLPAVPVTVRNADGTTSVQSLPVGSIGF